MASTKKAPYSAKAKVWFPHYTMELNGSAKGVIYSIFGDMPDDMRAEVIAKLNEKDQAILKRKAEAPL